MLKNTAFGQRLVALLLVWHLVIWSSASTHANQISLVLYHLWKNFFGIYNFCAFVHWDQDTHNHFYLVLQVIRKNFRGCSGLPFSTVPALCLAPVVVDFIQFLQLCFFSAWDLLLVSEHGEVAVIYDNITLTVIRLLKEILQ